MVEETNRLIQEFLKHRLNPELGILWWNEERIDQLNAIINNLERVKKQCSTIELKQLRLNELEKFLQDIYGAYEGNKHLLEWLKGVEKRDKKVIWEINERIEAITNFLSGHIDLLYKGKIDDKLIDGFIETIKSGHCSRFTPEQFKTLIDSMDGPMRLSTLNKLLHAIDNTKTDKYVDEDMRIWSLGELIGVAMHASEKLGHEKEVEHIIKSMLKVMEDVRGACSATDNAREFIERLGEHAVRFMINKLETAKEYEDIRVALDLFERINEHGEYDRFLIQILNILLRLTKKEFYISKVIIRFAEMTRNEEVIRKVKDYLARLETPGELVYARHNLPEEFKGMTTAIKKDVRDLLDETNSRDEEKARKLLPLAVDELLKGRLKAAHIIKAQNLIAIWGDASLIPLFERSIKVGDFTTENQQEKIAVTSLRALRNSHYLNELDRKKIEKLIEQKEYYQSFSWELAA